MEEAKKSRTASRIWVKRLCNKLQEQIDSEVENIDRYNLSDLLRNIHRKIDELNTSQNKIECLISETDLEEDIIKAMEFMDSVKPIILNGEKVLSKLETETLKQNTPTPSESHTGPSTVHLPKLDLPPFSGDILLWQPFWDQFVAVIDSSDLPDISKYTYLRSLLKGEALSCVKGLSVTAESYSIAKQILIQRYGRPERIVFSHLQKLLQMESVTTLDSTALWKLHDDLTSHIRSLETLGIGGDHYGVVLTPLILSRLPMELRMEWAREGEGKEGDLDFLMSFLFKEIQRRERSHTFSGSQDLRRRSDEVRVTSKHTYHRPSEQKGQRSSATSLYNSSTPTCIFCDGVHSSEKCRNIQKISVGDRKLKISQARVCFSCFGRSHLAKQCKRRCSNCNGRHHVLICTKTDDKSSSSLKTTNEQTDLKEQATSHVGVSSSSSVICTLMQTVCVKIGGSPVTVLFDSGSDRTYISSSLVKRIKPKFISSEPLAYACFGNGEPCGREERNLFEIKVAGQAMVVTEINNICAPLIRPKVPKEHLEAFGHIKFDIDYTKNENVTIDLLIGLDYYWKFVCDERIRSGGLVAQKTTIGWMLSGAWAGSENHERSCQFLSFNDLSQSMSTMWDLESLGIRTPEKNMTDDKILESFNDTVQYTGTRYEVALPWKDDSKNKLLNNFSLAMKRLNNLDKKLSHNHELKTRYDNALTELENDEIIQEVPKDQLNANSDSPVFYLPHRPVVREQSLTTKIRPVFDASAKGYNGVSLNDCMEVGPNLLPNLIDILIRFRRWPFALTADITKAFLQIKVCKGDQDVHRFLWKKDETIRVMRFDRVPFGNKCSPFLLNATIKHHLLKRPLSKVVEELNANLYVDDWLSGADNESELFDMRNESQALMKDAGMPLTKWSSNVPLVSDESDSKCINLKGPLDSDSDCSKVLGLKWLTDLDCFMFEGIDIPHGLKITKRVILSLMARLFDPLGFLSPFSTLAKIIFQDLWKLGCDWDCEIPTDLEVQFSNWIRGLHLLHSWKLQRCFVRLSWENLKSLEVHVFSDASEKAYGACVYLKILEQDDSHTISLVTAKAKIAPVKSISLPRLELLAALIGSRLISQVKEALKLPQTINYYCWSDSEIVLHWIKSEPWRWKTFVANRVSEINDLTCSEKWFHCPGKDNPADLLSRGMLAEDLISSRLWLNGPVWLNFDVKAWTRDVSNCSHLHNYSLEAKDPIDRSSLLSSRSIGQNSFFDIGRYSTLTKAIRVFAWVLRCVKILKLKTKRYGDLSFDELAVAKVQLLKLCQEESFCTEITALKAGNRISKQSPLSKLNPFLDTDGLLRMHGRLHFTQLTLDEKFPIIIPKGKLALLIIRYQHQLLKHAGVALMLSSLRNSYWIIGARKLAKKVKRECVPCQRIDKRVGEQCVAPLPKNRVTQSPPFSVTGLDYAGPLYCSDHDKKKFYILLFTCGVVRAVHLELVESLSLTHFIFAFRRFVARRGLPTAIYSDNAKTFQGAEVHLLKMYGDICPEWKFIVPRSPWWGGWWERLVRSVKSSLKKSIGSLSLTKTELETCLHEVEACINSRPLTFVGDDVDSQSPLTPSHFLLCRASVWENSAEHHDFDISSQQLLSLNVARNTLLERFWNIWNKEYIRNLRQISSGKHENSFQIGSVVLIKVDNCPRLSWPLGVIRKLFPGRDGIVRAVEVETAKGMLSRSIQTLVHLELEHSTDDDISESVDNGPVIPHLDKINQDNVHLEAPVVPPVFTRYGRQSRPVQRLDL